MSKKEPTFEELAGELQSEQAREFVTAVSMSAAPDPFMQMTDFEKLEQLAEEEAPKPPDDNENRFGFSPVFDIHVAKKNANNNYGKFGRFDFLPRLALIPFYDTVFSIPAEIKGRTVSGESIDDVLDSVSGEFDESAMSSAIAGGFNRIKKSAKQLSELFMADHAAAGAGVFDKLQNLKYKHAKAIYTTVLPYDDKQFWIDNFGVDRCKPRTLLGFRIDDNPFLDVIMDYLTYKAIDIIEKADLTERDMIRALDVHEKLLAYCETAVIHAKQSLDEKEQEIREGKTRGGYDRPNRLVVGSPKPPDLVRLAHLNRVAMEDRATADIMAMGKTIAGNMNQGTAQNIPAPGGTYADAVNQAKSELMVDPDFIKKVTAGVLVEAGLK